MDAQVEGVHFARAVLRPQISAIARSWRRSATWRRWAARPRAALCALVIVPGALPEAELYAIVDGIAEAQRELGCRGGR